MGVATEIYSSRTQHVDGKIVYYPQEKNDTDIVGDHGFYQMAMQEFGYRILRGSAAGLQDGNVHEERFRRQIEVMGPIHHAVEIGTWRGLSAAILGHYARRVTTIDVRYYEEPQRLWFWCGMGNTVRQVVVENNDVKERVLYDMDFDFAFIDGMHTYEDVEFDFSLVKKCGRVLFHDYCDKCPDVMAFIDTLENVTIDEPFALWRINNGNHSEHSKYI